MAELQLRHCVTLRLSEESGCDEAPAEGEEAFGCGAAETHLPQLQSVGGGLCTLLKRAPKLLLKLASRR